MRLAALRDWLVGGRGAGPASTSNAASTSDAASASHIMAAAQPSEVAAGAAPGLVVSAGSHDAEARTSSLWSAARIAVEEELWGVGFLSPGGGPEMLRFAAPMGLSAASSLLLLGAGTGGPPQTLATDMGVWVASHETDPDLVTLAGRRIQRSGAALAKRATVQLWDRHAPRFRPRICHHALAIDAIRDATPEPVLDAIAQALKPHGQVVLVETVSATPLDPADPAIAAWCRLEGRAPSVPAPEAITRCFTRLGYDVRVDEDMTARHMRLAVLGWKHLVRQMTRERPTAERAAAVVVQAEMWTRRIRLMRAGQIRLIRWHAIGPGGGPA